MLKESGFVIIRVMAPIDSANKIREVLGEAGAGAMGEYKFCSYSSRGIGRFLPTGNANPTIGQIGKLEEVEEEMIQTICHKDLVEQVIKKMIKAHPYERPAFDIIPRLELPK